ncbi:cupin domain-containing protein [Hymenobacter mucosus]|uniref:AraC-type arabinose-binding/dimerisation domain-containing protein n=1 Tax=Hymenobacter mucosus TaxID=1411120 RepID=A0A238VZL0_9BACT|nr:hypothetical protein [Hymenobacter mucosus]SNR39611.1 hypothetical protein SAMN06269173_10271 [Hymenobacter mucosus]
MTVENQAQHTIPAIRLFNTADGSCTFEVGTLPTGTPLHVSYFEGQNAIFDYQKKLHPAPRTQYVVTLRGKLRFTVSNGDTFILEPGIILLAEDTQGPGHYWDLIEGDTWERLYLPFTPGATQHFTPMQQDSSQGST